MRLLNSARGSALVFTLAILMVLSLMGVAFTRSCKQEKTASQSFIDNVRARFTALAGIEHGRRAVMESCFKSSISTLQEDWCYVYSTSPTNIYSLAGIELDSTLAAGQRYSCQTTVNPSWGPVVCSGYVAKDNTGMGSYEQYGNLYFLKILDCSSQININCQGEPEALIRILNALGEAIQERATAGHPVISAIPSVQDPIQGQAADLINQRDTNWHGRFRSKQEVRQAFINVFGESTGTLNYNIVKDFITLYSTFVPSDLEIGFSGGHNLPPKPTDPSGVGKLPKLTSVNPSNNLRAYVNINTASVVVIEALIRALGARVPAFRTLEAEMDDSYSNSAELFDEKLLRYEMDYVDVSFENYYQNITDKIIARRNSGHPITTRQQLYDFFDGNQDIDGDGSDDINTSLVITNADLPINTSFLGDDEWYQICRDVLKANFDPNYREHRFNPNIPAALRVSRTDLYVKNGTQAERSHTMPFCFCPTGSFEIQCLAWVTRQNGHPVGRHNIRSCIHMYDILSHSTQFDFYNNGDGDFTNVTSYPENLNDLADYNKINSALLLRYSGWIEPRVDFVDGHSIEGTVGYAPTFSTRYTHSVPTLNADTTNGGDGTAFSGNPDERADGLPAPYTYHFDVYPNFKMHECDSSNTCALYTSLLDNTINTALMPDGILGHISRQQYLIYQASRHGHGAGYHRGKNCPTGYNVPYYKGAVEFWVKLAMDADKQVPAGIMGWTQAFWPADSDFPDTARPTGPEGVQMFIRKNASPSGGRLRFSRIYFGQSFDDQGNTVGLGVDDPLVAVRRGDRDTSPADDYYAYPAFRYIRKELVVPANWKAHEWHHVVFAWRSGRGVGCPRDGLMRCWIDGKRTPSQELFLPADFPDNATREQYDAHVVNNLDNGDTEYITKFVTANARAVDDSLYIGGTVRYQVRADGIFKYGKNEIMLPLNGTMDMVRFFDMEHFDFGASGVSFPVPSRLFKGTARFTNYFNLPPNATLGTVSWSVLFPKEEPTSNSMLEFPNDMPYLSVAVARSNGTPAIYHNLGNPTNEGYAYGTAVPLDNATYSTGQRFYYRVSFSPPVNNPDEYSVAAIFDDIILTYTTGAYALEWEEISP